MNAAQVSEWITGLEQERDELVSALTEAEKEKFRLRREILVAQNAAKDIERLKDAEIAKLKARIAEMETKPGPLKKLDLLRDTLVEVEDLIIKLRQGI